MTFADPTRASSAELLAEQEKEVMIKRLKDGEEMPVSNRLAQDLLARKPAEFALLDKPTVMDEVTPEVVAPEAPVIVDAVVEAPVAPEGEVVAE